MKTHSFDGVSFFSGLIITAIGLVFLIAPEPGDIFDVFGGAGAWFWPVLLLVIGIAVLVPALMPSRNDEQLPPGTD
jgi:hypothetical protein